MKVDLTHYKPLPSQDYLHKSESQFKAYFGGFGSGKSNWLCWEALRLSLDHPNNYGLIMRRTYPELDDTIMKDFLEILPPELIRSHERGDRRITLINGSVILFRSFDSIGKIFSYNLGWFGIDQAEELPEDFFLALVSRMRKINIPVKHGLLALNPAGHNWVWRRFINANSTEETLRYSDKDYAYVIAKTDENTYLPEGYVENLRKLYPPQWVARYVDCEFNDFEGLVYSNFGDKNNLTFREATIKHYIKTNDVIIAIDIGIDAPTAVLFAVRDAERKRIVIFDEIYERGLTIKPISILIKSRMKKWGIQKVWKFLIDPDAKKRQITSGSSAIQDFRNNGINALPAVNNIDYGILKVNELFGTRGEEKPKLVVSRDLNHFFVEINDYVYKINKNTLSGENSPGKPMAKNDHLMDVLRYIVLAIPLMWISDNGGDMKSIWETHFAKKFKRKKTKTSEGRRVKRFTKRG